MIRRTLSCFNLHPAGQPEHNPVVGVNCHAVHLRGPYASVVLRNELLQVLHGLSEALYLPAADHDLIDLLDARIALSLGILIPADQRSING